MIPVLLSVYGVRKFCKEFEDHYAITKKIYSCLLNSCLFIVNERPKSIMKLRLRMFYKEITFVVLFIRVNSNQLVMLICRAILFQLNPILGHRF